MFCKYCGMESTTNDKCSWCHKALAVTAPVATPPPPITPEEPVIENIALLATAEMQVIPEPQFVPPPVVAVQPAVVVPIQPALPKSSPTDTPPAARPSIGVRRPGAPRPAEPQTSGIAPSVAPATPAPPMPPTPTVAPVATAPPTTQRPAPPATTTRPVAPTAQRPVAPETKPGSKPQTPIMAPAASAILRKDTMETNSPIPLSKPRPAAPSAQPAAQAKPTQQPSAPQQPIGAKRPTAPVAKPVPTMAANSTGGLADGIALGSRSTQQPAAHIPQLGTVTTVKSKYYQDVVIDPVSGTHYDLMTSKPMAANGGGEATPTLQPERELIVHYIDEDEESNNLLLRYSVAFLGISLITYYIVALAPPIYWLTLMLCNIFSGMLLPVLKIAPWHDEDSDDIGWLFLGTLVGGPVVSLIAYAAVTMLRREFNPGVLGCLAVSAVSRLTVEIAAGSPTLSHIFIPWSAGVTPTIFAVSWAGLVTMLGWILGNVFHKLDE